MNLRLKAQLLEIFSYDGLRGFARIAASVLASPFRKRFRPDELDPSFRALRTIQAGIPQCVKDDLTGEWRVSSGAFSASRDGYMSIDLEELLRRDGRPIDYLFPNLPRAVAMVAHPLKTYFSYGFAVEHQPLPTNYYHGGIKGNFKKQKRKLAGSCEYVCPIDVKLAERYSHPPEVYS